MSIVAARGQEHERRQPFWGVNNQLADTGAKPRLLMVGWQGPPFNGRVHVVSSLVKAPFTDRFAFTQYDTRMRNARGGSRPDISLLRSAIQQVTHLRTKVSACQPAAAMFFIGPGPAFWRDLLLLHTLHQIGIPVLIRLFGGVLTEHFHDMPRSLRELTINEFSRAKAILVETQAMVADLGELCPTVPAYRVANFIHVDDLPKRENRARGFGDPFRVIYMGNMTPTKGVETILQSVDQTVSAVGMQRRVEFHFIGGELERGYLEGFRNRCARLRYASRVTVHGKQTREAAHAIAATGDVFAFPTCWPGEGQPAALIEAMGMGLVPIATNWRGIADIVHDEENGILLDSADAVSGLSIAINTLTQAPCILGQLSNAAQEQIAAEYDAAPALRRFSQIFEQTMGVTHGRYRG